MLSYKVWQIFNINYSWIMFKKKILKVLENVSLNKKPLISKSINLSDILLL